MKSLTLLALALSLAANAQPPTDNEIKVLTGEIAAVVGFSLKRPLQMETIPREGWQSWIEKQIQTNVKPEELRAEALALKKFGLIPRDFNLKKATIDLLTEQAAAVYDHRGKKLLFVDGAAEEMRDMVLVHELAHALADQNFNLERFLDKAPGSDESQLARLAVVEGQATWIMYDWMLKKTGMSLADSPAAATLMSSAGAKMASGMFPVFDQMPLYMKETLLFPYTAGFAFQDAAFRRLQKKAFAEVLRRPPSTAREILHPEIWLSGWKPEPAPLPQTPVLSGYQSLVSGTVGQLDWRILFEQYGDAAMAQVIATGWRGGSFDLWEKGVGGRTILRFSAVWDSEETSAAFIRQYEGVLRGKWNNHKPRISSPDELTGEGDDGVYRIWREGRVVKGLEGMEPERPTAHREL